MIPVKASSFGRRTGCARRYPGGRRYAQHRAHRLAGPPKAARRRALAQSLHIHAAPHRRIEFHSIHPSCVPQNTLGMLGGPRERSGFPPPSGRVTPPLCGLVLLCRSQAPWIGRHQPTISLRIRYLCRRRRKGGVCDECATDDTLASFNEVSSAFLRDVAPPGGGSSARRAEEAGAQADRDDALDVRACATVDAAGRSGSVGSDPAWIECLPQKADLVPQSVACGREGKLNYWCFWVSDRRLTLL